MLPLSGCGDAGNEVVIEQHEVVTEPNGRTRSTTTRLRWGPPPPPPTCPKGSPGCDDTPPPLEPFFMLQPGAGYIGSISNTLTQTQSASSGVSIRDAIASGDYSFDLTTNVPSSFPQNSTSGIVSLTVNGVTHTLNVEYAINDHQVTPLDPAGIAAWYDRYKLALV